MGVIFVILMLLQGLSFTVIAQTEHSNTTTNISGSYDMVVISPSIFSTEIQPLIEHKNDHNVRTFLKTTEEIYDQYQGRDKAEQIKYFIKYAIEESGITYVLLIGGRVGQSFRYYVPIRYSNVDDGYMHKQILSDLYFADIYDEKGDFDDWDSNGNGVFAEWTGNSMNPDDTMDLVPDVAVGRLPCRSNDEVKDIVTKIITYENTISTQNRFNNFLLIGGDTNPGIGDPFPYEGEALCEWTKTLLPDFSATTLYVSDGSITGPDDFISSFNEGYGFVLYHGHGLQDGLATYKPDSSELVEVVHNDNVRELVNDMLPVTVVGCCQTSDFDTSIFNFLDFFNNKKQHIFMANVRYECVRECLGWNMVKKPFGGSIAHLGSTSTAWGSTGDTNKDGIPDSAQYGYTSGICTEFFRIYGEKNQTKLGDIYSGALTSVIENNNAQKNKVQCKCVQEFILIGDPSLEIGGYKNI